MEDFCYPEAFRYVEDFRYQSLDLRAPTIRILRLNTGIGPIECDLFHIDFRNESEIVTYEALSYAWGSDQRTQCILVNGARLRVTENLYQALLHLRQSIDRILWIDAICIDQQDLLERGHQVQQMGVIYARAEQVVIWLGKLWHHRLHLVETMTRLQEKGNARGFRRWRLTDQRWKDLWEEIKDEQGDQQQHLRKLVREGLESILQESWWQRVWILQEVANGRTARVQIGNEHFSTRLLAVILLLSDVRPPDYCQAVLDLMPGISKESAWGKKRDLYTLLIKFRQSQASDPRDMIYALLGICSDYRLSHAIAADYTKNEEQVIKNVSRELFGEIECHHNNMSQFLDKLTRSNVEGLFYVAENETFHNVRHYLDKENRDLSISEDLIIAGTRNTKQPAHIVELLFQRLGRDLIITSSILLNAMRNPDHAAATITVLLLQHVEQGSMTEEVLRAAATVSSYGNYLIALFSGYPGMDIQISDEVLMAAVKDDWTESAIDFCCRLAGTQCLLLQARYVTRWSAGSMAQSGRSWFSNCHYATVNILAICDVLYHLDSTYVQQTMGQVGTSRRE